MEIKKTIQNGVLTIELEGRLDSQSASVLEEAVNESIDVAGAFVFDFSKLEYLSSAGLRILLTTQQTMEETGRPDVIVRGMNEQIKGIFEVTGFDSVMNIE